MLVRFVRDYQGKATGPHFYRAGETADLSDITAQVVMDEGAAVEAAVAVEAAEEPRTEDKRGKRK